MHVPVMVREVLEGLALGPGELLLDCTLGLGGHAREFLRRGVRVVGVELNPETREFADYSGVEVLAGSYAELLELWDREERPKGALFDLGLSSFLLEGVARGFSFRYPDEPLDMRFDPSRGRPAWWWLDRLTPDELAEVLKLYGEVRRARAIAREIVRRRPMRKVGELVEAVAAAAGRNPLPQVFQALRILVNDELASLAEGLAAAAQLLLVGGRLAVISYHSLEDRVAKALKDVPGLRPLNKKPITPSPEEVAANPRARSAKLRLYEKTEEINAQDAFGYLSRRLPPRPRGLA